MYIPPQPVHHITDSFWFPTGLCFSLAQYSKYDFLFTRCHHHNYRHTVVTVEYHILIKNMLEVPAKHIHLTWNKTCGPCKFLWHATDGPREFANFFLLPQTGSRESVTRVVNIFINQIWANNVLSCLFFDTVSFHTECRRWRQHRVHPRWGGQSRG